MAEFEDRHPRNAPGKYYMDGTCADCGGCHAILCACIRRDAARCNFYIARQPATPEEINLAEQCVANCPHEAMGNDGDLHDWGETFTAPPIEAVKPNGSAWWKIW